MQSVNATGYETKRHDETRPDTPRHDMKQQHNEGDMENAPFPFDNSWSVVVLLPFCYFRLSTAPGDDSDRFGKLSSELVRWGLLRLRVSRSLWHLSRVGSFLASLPVCVLGFDGL
ncbi:hypothetical protein FRB91_005634 [Serendipita sp. 411]|nr:hypothetical protein FRB91_005634 [Serendipita sp. 411]